MAFLSAKHPSTGDFPPHICPWLTWQEADNVIKNTKHLPREWAGMLSVLRSATYCDKGISAPDSAALTMLHCRPQSKLYLPMFFGCLVFLLWPGVTCICCSVFVEMYSERLKQDPNADKQEVHPRWIKSDESNRGNMAGTNTESLSFWQGSEKETGIILTGREDN